MVAVSESSLAEQTAKGEQHGFKKADISLGFSPGGRLGVWNDESVPVKLR